MKAVTGFRMPFRCFWCGGLVAAANTKESTTEGVWGCVRHGGNIDIQRPSKSDG